MRRKKIEKSFLEKVGGWIKNTFTFRQATGNKDENPFTRTIKRIGYAIFGDNGRADEFNGPDFDLEEVIRAYNTESYVRQALDKYIELLFKSGWKFVYNDERVHEYLEMRFHMLSDAMGIPLNQFWRGVAEDLVKFHNAFIVKKRVDPAKMPKYPVTYKGLGGKKPVGAYFILPPETVKIMVDKYGTVKKYQQDNGEEQVEFKPEDVIHITYKKPSGKFFGVPFLIPVIDDIKLLRQVEDNVARLIYRFLYPLFIYKVGLAQAGYESTDEEIQDMQQEISNMPIDGGLVIPERHDVDLLTTNGNFDASKYLDYYERRVFTGLGVSQTVMGRSDTSNRSTAENQSSEMRDKVKAFQSVLQDYFTHFIIRELLLEGGFDPVLNPDQAVEFEFNEIDTELLIKRENHAVFKFEHSAITHEEMRYELNMEPVADESRLHNNMFAAPENIADTDNRANPQNQHNPNEFIVNDLQADIIENRINSIYVDFKIKAIEANKNNLDITSLIDEFYTRITFYIENGVKKAYLEGYSDALLHIEGKKEKKISEQVIKNILESLEDSKQKLKDLALKSGRLEGVLSYYDKEIAKLLREKLLYSYNAGLLNTFQKNGYKEVCYTLNGDNEIYINLGNNLLEMIPATKISPIIKQTPIEGGDANEVV